MRIVRTVLSAVAQVAMGTLWVVLCLDLWITVQLWHWNWRQQRRLDRRVGED